MRTSEIAGLIRNSYFSENVLQGNLSISDENSNEATTSAVGTHPSLPAITADPIQPDLYFESADGYGKWRILCSRRFLSDVAQDGARTSPVLRRLEYVPITSLRNGQT